MRVIYFAKIPSATARTNLVPVRKTPGCTVDWAIRDMQEETNDDYCPICVPGSR